MIDAYTVARGNSSRSFSTHCRRTIHTMHRNDPSRAAVKQNHISVGRAQADHGTAAKRAANASSTPGTRLK